MARLKRLVIPSFWRVARKENKWVVAPRAGPHKKFESVPLQVLLRDVLKIDDKGKDIRTIIKKGEIVVDGRKRKDHAYPVGLFDIVSIPALDKNYRAVPSKNTMSFIEIPKSEAKVKICRIQDKTIIAGGKVQLNLHDGKNVIVDKDEYKTGDSLLMEVPSLKIVEHIKLEKGAVGMVSRGKDSGSIGKVKEIIVTATKDPTKLIYEKGEGEDETLKDRFFVIGKSKPLITVKEAD
ncbi:MAG: 30S ribosomal protein S4e [Candidatus Aenigmarchaeota archaeon]|nr:30S ribosomal protein S4e [Candidatus Aenigmarchaeota archaeon]